MVLLFCLIQSVPAEDPFPVKVEDVSMTVNDLKNAIRNSRPKRMGRLDAADLVLWKVHRLLYGLHRTR